jgi:hypothetical protein
MKSCCNEAYLNVMTQWLREERSLSWGGFVDLLANLPSESRRMSIFSVDCTQKKTYEHEV